MWDSDFEQWAVCPHLLRMNRYGDPERRSKASAFQTMSVAHAAKGRAQALSSLEITTHLGAISLSDRLDATVGAIEVESALIFGGRLAAEGIETNVDLLEWQTDHSYLPGLLSSGLSAEGANTAANRFRIAVALRALQDHGVGPAIASGFVVLRDGSRHRIPIEPSDMAFLERDNPSRISIESITVGQEITRPALGAACTQCDWKKSCQAEATALDDLTRIAELGRNKRDVLLSSIPTVSAMASIDVNDYLKTPKKTVFPGIGPNSLRKFKERAQCLTGATSGPYLKKPLAIPELARVIFFDLETDPFTGNFVYLHGCVEQDNRTGSRQFQPFITPTVTAQAERDTFARALAYLDQQLQRGDATIIHYAPFERSTYAELARRFPDVATEDQIATLFAHPHVIDLYTDWVRPHSVWPCSDLSIKTLARLVGFQWRDSDPSGANSIVWFHDWAANGNNAALQRVLDYNEDDNLGVAALLGAMHTLPILYN